MLAAVKRNRSFLLVVSGLSLLGALCFGAAIWKLNSNRGKPDPRPVAIPTLPPRPAPPPPKKVAPVRTVAPAPAPPVEWDSPPSRRQAGYLNVRANVPAYVYVDGARVRQRTPLRHYRVRPGRRKIAIEAIATGDRREFTVVISRGRQRTIQELGLKGRPR
jgi:hypothetical protein